ncbi:MAG: cell surface protein SprA [Bacteroidaceae bacterium]|nr:cell surface protein SprA [Bacteroidaceae bacterium]
MRRFYVIVAAVLAGVLSEGYLCTLQAQQTQGDTIRLSRFRVSKTSAENSEDLNSGSAADLKTPENITQATEYDVSSHTYTVGTKLGDYYLDVPILMTPEEYNRWSLNKSMQEYFRSRNETEYESSGKEKFDFTDMHFDLGPAEKIFGPGGVQIKTNGSASLKFGLNSNRVDNPSLSAQNRKTFGFDFDEQINLSMNAKVGDKINMDLNYNTEATFTFDTRKIKLRYEGKEDEIIKLFEAGNVSFPSNSSLIQGATSLFGIRTDLQFGKLSLQTVISQKESSSRSVSSKSGNQVSEYEIDASDYDENRHFFLAQYFRDRYDSNMEMLPAIMSGVIITRIEVWVTNKRSSYDSPRNILAFTDLGESEHIFNENMWRRLDGPQPSNTANTLYRSIISDFPSARNADSIAIVFNGILSGGNDYEKISNARKLNENEYILNGSLGYISLKSSLTSDEALAVAFEYTYGGQTYQVGEFSGDIPDSRQTLYLKLLKSNSNSPASGTWNLMMKNVYSISSGSSLQRTGFKLKIYYASDSTGTNLTYLPEAGLKSSPLLSLMNLDRLDENQTAHPNGQFDFVEGYTVEPQTGRIIFPVVEPFGSHLRKVIGDDRIADKYVFQELYDSTKTVARRIAEKDKFIIGGEMSGSSGNVISLGAFNIPRGSVVVSAGGVILTENTDYTVDYGAGTVTIINQSIIDAGTDIDVSLESNTNYSMQRKTMAGVNWKYDFTDNFQMSGTLMHMNEKPLTSKVAMGSEPLVNTMLGVNLNWKKESQALTKLVNFIPFVNATDPSRITLSTEMAKLYSDVSSKVQGNASYIDDFEAAESGISISQPTAWSLAAIPQGENLFEYSNVSNDVRTGYRRALLNWFTIDPLFTRRNSSLTPSHIKSDLDQLSSHFVREIYERELYPNKESNSSESTTLSVLNLAYYPQERGPYNLNPDLTHDGHLKDPAGNWGGIMRSLSTTDFESANIEYIEFWMMDPFVYDEEAGGGDLYINLGEVSEDVLKDGKKFFENGIPADGDPAKYSTTVWGRVPTISSLIYAFDNNDSDNRGRQDVGLNGLSSEDEADFPTYRDYLEAIRPIVSDSTYRSILSDPANDNYHYFRGSDYDDAEVSILERYKRYNGTEGNSPNSGDTGQSYNSSAKTTPDVEDANSDYTLDEYEKYFSYRVSLRPSDLVVGSNFIVDRRDVKVKLRNNRTENVSWYCFRVPIDQFDKAYGGIRDFSSIRFMRMFLTGFKEETHIRFGTLELMTSQWRLYDKPVSNPSLPGAKVSGKLTAASVNIEENGDRKPVNYVVPPGITRILDPNQTQLIQDNEQAMSIKVEDLDAGDARGIYKKTSLDLRKYERIQMFSHAEALADEVLGLKDGDVSVFIRLGSDYSNNFYEYEIPLKVTEPGFYNGDNESSRRQVWPKENMLDITFDVLTAVKNKRNRERNNPESGVSTSTIFSDYDPEHPDNRISVIGNPSIGNVKAIMIGVRNNSLGVRSAEVWINELRLVGYESHGGSAAQGSLNVQLSDLMTLDLKGKYSSAGYGGLEQGISERSMDDYYKYSFTTSVNVGRFLPEKAKISIPLYYSYTKEKTSPKYSPFDTDLELDDVIESYPDEQRRDSVRSITQEVKEQRNFSITGAKVNISSKKSMPYDPANFSINYSRSTQDNSGSTIEYEKDLRWRGSLSYSYSSPLKGYAPFQSKKNFNSWFKVIKDFTFNPLPQNITFNAEINRNYHELQERDLESMTGDNGIPVTFSQQFYLNRDFSMRWDIFKDLKMNLSTRTQAEIEEPYGVVNKDLYPDEYEIWKDSVKVSLLKMGQPLDYQQTYTASYVLPLGKLPVLNWTTTSLSYNSQYSWNRGTKYADGSSFGNIIASRRSLTATGKFDLQKLYNKSKFLKDVNNRYNTSDNSRNLRKEADRKRRPKAFSQEILLLPDSTYTIEHNQGTLRPDVRAITADGAEYKLKYRRSDGNSITIKSKDSVRIKLNVAINPEKLNRQERIQMNDVAQFSARMLMMVRTFSVTYKDDYSMTLPGFMPNAGSMFGQKSLSDGMAPGLDFAFGLIGDDYLQKVHDRGWLLSNDSIAQNAQTSSTQSLQMRMNLEPVSDVKIDLNAQWNRNQAKKIQYMYKGMPTTGSGTFSMTTITIGSAFESHKASNDYHSKAFDRFCDNLDVMQARIERRYEGARYPLESSMPGELYNKANGGVNKYSADVMIPAFLAAYTGRDASSSSLSLFPSMLSMLPNWSITYNGLNKLQPFNRYFKNFSLTHSYKSVFSMGGYSTFSSYMEYMNGPGFIQDVTSGNPVPSSMYDISAVSINESFSPLIGVNMTLNNGITAKFEIRKTRIMNLSMTAIQMVETTSDDIVAGGGYRLTDLKILGARPGTGRNKVSNDLNLNCDVSIRRQNALCRSISALTTQATSGSRAVKVAFSADYTYSKMITLNFYYDFQSSFPLVSTSSFPTSTHDAGFTIKFALTR